MDKNTQILIVDDEPRFTQSLKRLFDGKGYPVRTAADGAQALQAFESSPVKVVVTDIEMPGKNGHDLVEELIQKDPFVQVIFLTGHADIENTKKAFRQGGNTFEFFKKPLEDMDVLFQAVDCAASRYDQWKQRTENRARAEKTLAAAGHVFDSIEALIVVSDISTCEIIYTNRKFNLAMGYASDENLNGRKCWQVIHQGGKEPCEFCTNRRITDDRGRPSEPFEWELTTAANTRRYTVLDKAMEWHDKRIVKLSTLYDITEKRKYEELFKAYEKKYQSLRRLESIGTLAGGIAHQFNNSLSVIAGNLELMEMDYPHERKLTHYVQTMRKSAEKMAGLTASLLAYARGGKYRAQESVFSNLVDEIIEEMKPMITGSTRVITDIGGEACRVKVDRTQLQMLLSAVLENAVEAGCDRVCISLRRKVLDRPEAEPNQNCEYLCLEISDNGRGMDRETLATIFEPFFTTKFQGRGLGMSAAYGIVKSHGGFISVDSGPDEGTCVRMYFPVSGGKESRNVWDECKQRPLNILLVEDKEDVRSSTRLMLEKMGHRIFEAGTGREAVQFLQAFKKNIHLVLLDFLLPDVNGDIVYDRIRKNHPETRVVILNEDAVTEPIRRILEIGPGSFMQKPVTMDELSEKITEIQDC